MTREERPEFAITTPVGEIVEANGEVKQILETIATSEEMREVAGDDLKRRFGGRIKRIPEGAGGRFFGFTKWNTPWNPTGPKRNWAQPENPSRN